MYHVWWGKETVSIDDNICWFLKFPLKRTLSHKTPPFIQWIMPPSLCIIDRKYLKLSYDACQRFTLLGSKK